MTDWDGTENQILRGVVSSSLGDSIEYRKHDTINWFTIRGCVSDQFVEVDSSTGEAFVSKRPTVTVLNNTIPGGPEKYDKVRQREKEYRVDSVQDDGHTGGHSLILKIIDA